MDIGEIVKVGVGEPIPNHSVPEPIYPAEHHPYGPVHEPSQADPKRTDTQSVLIPPPSSLPIKDQVDEIAEKEVERVLALLHNTLGAQPVQTDQTHLNWLQRRFGRFFNKR